MTFNTTKFEHNYAVVDIAHIEDELGGMDKNPDIAAAIRILQINNLLWFIGKHEDKNGR